MKKFLFVIVHLIIFVSINQLYGQHSYTLVYDTISLPYSFRGACVVNDKIAWVSGNKACVGKTTDGGSSWSFYHVLKDDKAEIRDIEAWDDETAVVLSVKDPAQILRTTDGGKTWISAFKDESHKMFLDGFAFWDKNRGIAFGDPVNNHFTILLTGDGGKSWTELSGERSPLSVTGEAGFAASGTGIFALKGGLAWFGTGGSESNIFVTSDYGQSWTKHITPIVTGMGSKGINSVYFIDEKNGIAVGGDFTAPNNNEDVYAWTHDGGKTWHLPHHTHHLLNGYRSCVELVGKHQFIAVGKNGTDMSHDGGKNWHAITKEGFHVIAKSRKGKWILLAGDGVIARLVPK